MPSPFPGMDPFLEGEMWQEFHGRFANQISEQLLPQLAPKYVALLAKRYAFEYPLGITATPKRKTIYPDVHVAKQAREAYATSGDIPAPIELKNPLPEAAPYLAIEIRDVAERRLVTVIEILSPENKHGKGVSDYREKRLALLETDTHLLELDLLRQGTRIELVGELPPAAYFVLLSRWNRRPKTEVWAIQLRDNLPSVPVSLLPPDADVKLNLQSALNACFDLVGYERLLDYAQPLDDLSAQDSEWIKGILDAKIAIQK